MAQLNTIHRSEEALSSCSLGSFYNLFIAFGRLSFCSSRRIAYRAAPAPRRRPWSAQHRLRRPCAQRAGCAGLECGGHTFTLPCQVCERVLAAQFPIAIRTTRLQTNIGERTMRSRHPAFRVSTNSGRHEILSPLVCGTWSAFPFESFLQRQASPRQNKIENANSFFGNAARRTISKTNSTCQVWLTKASLVMGCLI